MRQRSRAAKSATVTPGTQMSSEPPPVFVELLPDHPDFGAPDPDRFSPARAGDAGIDLVACEAVELPPGSRAAVSVGFRIALPAGIEAQVRPRSGRALREGLSVVNAPGTIDPGYRGPVKVLLLNTAASVSPDDLVGPSGGLAERLADGLAARTIRIDRGERIAQLVLCRFERPDIRVVETVSTDTARGVGGFGSTGE